MNLFAEPADHAIGRSRGGLSTKIHALVDGKGRPLTLLVAPGQGRDAPMFPHLMKHLKVNRAGPGRPGASSNGSLTLRCWSNWTSWPRRLATNHSGKTKSDTSTPSIYKLKPTSGKVGTAVTIVGTNLLGIQGVTFGTVKARFTVVSPTQISTTVPKGAKTGKIVLQYKIGASVSQAGNGLSGSTGITPSNTPSNSGAKAAYQFSPRNFVVR